MNRASDIVVVGGGAVGCAVAYYAAKRGLSVTLVDKPRRGRATSASAGGTWPIGESLGLGCGIIFYKALLKKGALQEDAQGPEPLPDFFLDFALQSNDMFPGLAREVLETGGVDMNFEKTSLLFVMLDEADATFARRLLKHFPRDKSRLQWVEREEINKEEPAVRPDNFGGLRFVGDDQVTPYLFADALRVAAKALGARIVTHTDVTGIRREDHRVTGVETSEGFLPCHAVVNAAGSWAPEVGRMVGLEIPVYPVRGQIVCTETLPSKTLRACLSTSDCYLAQKHHGEIIIGSTTEEVGYETAVTPEAIQELCVGAVRVLPFLRDVAIKRVWSGFRPGTRDELPILGPVEGLEGYYNACGHFRTGILNAPLSAKLITETIVGDAPSFDGRPFLLSRFRTERTLKPSQERFEPAPPKPGSSLIGSVGYSVKRFEGLVDLAAFLDGAPRIQPAAGDRVIAQGEMGDRFYVVARGSVRVERDGKHVARLGPGEFFGELALLDNKPRSATVLAEEGTELLVVPQDDFYKLLAEHPEISATIMRVMADRLRASTAART